jgi:hypothetical protein
VGASDEEHLADRVVRLDRDADRAVLDGFVVAAKPMDI